jgi:Flp pilus assembly pilin Flp
LSEDAVKVIYAILIGFVAASMITVVYRFEPNRAT